MHSDNEQEVPIDAGIDLQAALRRLGGDAELLREMAQIVVQDMPDFVRQAGRGLEDPETAARAAHSLKGLAANFSDAAARAAQEAESAVRARDGDRASAALAVLKAYIERLIVELQRTVLDQ